MLRATRQDRRWMVRRYGAGSVFPEKVNGRPTGRFLAQWELPREDGKRRRRQLVVESEAEGWRLMRKAQRTEGRSSSKSPRRTASVAAFLGQWLDDVVALKRRERTLVGYRAIVARIPPDIAARELADPQLGRAIETWLLGLRIKTRTGDRPAHPRTIHHYAACLRGAFAYAVRKRLMDRNPAADLDLPVIARTERIPLTAPELRAFLAAVDGPLAPLWMTAAWTGLRQGELLGLRWEDVSLERASLVVRSSLTRLPGSKGQRYVLSAPKTAESRRTVPLLPDVVAALRPLRKEYLRAKPELDQSLVFASPSGSPLDAARVSLAFTRALESTGTRRVRFHDLRHGTVSLLIEAGVDLATVSSILGHSTITTTVDMYGHLTESHKRTAMARLVAV